jgi:hypothetical protein
MDWTPAFAGVTDLIRPSLADMANNQPRYLPEYLAKYPATHPLLAYLIPRTPEFLKVYIVTL